MTTRKMTAHTLLPRRQNGYARTSNSDQDLSSQTNTVWKSDCPVYRLFVAALVILAACTTTPSWAQEAPGFYLGSGLGANFAPAVNLAGKDNDHSMGSGCDEFINPNATQYDFCNLGNRGDSWNNRFDGAAGILANAVVGYRLRNRLRLEVEYFYRDSEYDQTDPVLGGGGSIADKLAAELQRAELRVGSITSHNLFGNFYFDFPNRSRFTPYIGLGIGGGFADMDFGALWARNLNPAHITSVEGKFSEDDTEAIQSRLAGTTTSAQTELNDTLLGFQVLLGVNRALTDAVSLDVRGRWTNFSSFHDSDSYERLRSHESNLRVDGSAPVEYQQSTDDTELFGINVAIRYQF
ncbi:MAG: outer membrane beta-barrel protein [Gemmatimonadetes bacterium]|nr:outer membrane beta-barrel protein [Gemmatimonadota bacterium]